MELNAELLSLQSSLRDLEKTTNPFCKIKYKGGNEQNIDKIVGAIKLHIVHHKELKNKKDFLLLLIANTNLSHNTLKDVKEYQHLVNLIPLLSTCLLSNIMVQLDLIDAYCSVLCTIPLRENKEILFELEICLKQSEMVKTLNDTCTVLNALIELFISMDQNNEVLEQIADAFNKMLENLSKFNADKVQNWTFVRLQEHIGHTLLHILQLLNKCPTRLKRLIDSLINSAITIMKAVTLNVFCVWAEVQHEDGIPLQLIIAGEAYTCIEHLQKNPSGTTLVQMLGTIAKKSKTLSKRIQEADLETIINNVNRNKENQIKWFQALINTNVFDNDGAIDCLNKWHHLCTPDDVCRLFHLSKFSNDKIVTLKCASTLKVDDLRSIVIKHFWKYSDDWNVNISNELILLFNKMQSDNEIDQNVLKQIYLLLIQNRKMFLRTLYTNCLNTAANVKNFKSVFGSIKDIIEINNVSRNIFIEVFQNNFVSDENIAAFKELINALMDLTYLTPTVVLCDVFLPQLKKLYISGAFTSLCSTLRVLNVILIKYVLDDETLPFLTFLLELIESYRKSPTFLQHHRTVQECVSLITMFEKNGPYPFFKDQLSGFQLSPINQFHAMKLCAKTEDKLLKYLFSFWNVKEKAQSVAVLMKVLPICVKTEWILIASEIDSEGDYETTLNLFNKVIFLLSQITNGRQDVEEQENLLIFCLQQYLIVVKELLQPKHDGLTEERTLVKSVAALINDLPANVREKYYMTFIGILSDDALKSLKNDREFVVSLIAIRDINVAQVLAQRILS